MMEGNFLVATTEGKLYEILSDFQMNEVDNFTAIGSGSTFALGSLFTSKGRIKEPEARVFKALQTAAFFDAATGPPFITEIFLEDG
jgi:ATP-dependent protease HslVU (ClpYQ) peptidase subunit